MLRKGLSAAPTQVWSGEAEGYSSGSWLVLVGRVGRALVGTTSRAVWLELTVESMIGDEGGLMMGQLVQNEQDHHMAKAMEQ